LYHILAVFIGYLLGSISFSYLIAKKLAGIDIRKHGSGNAGATNTLRVLGKGPGILVLLLDALKGIAAVWIAMLISPANELTIALAGFAAILGHNWPIFFGFRGGKGVATTVGVIGTISFLPLLWSGLLAIATIALTRFVSLGSLLLMALVPIFMVIKGDHPIYILMTVAIAILGFIRHRQNIVRLLQGKENKLGKSRQLK
jgi:acyl phosphate:glycerol-3-phosphate acyltransferase